MTVYCKHYPTLKTSLKSKISYQEFRHYAILPAFYYSKNSSLRNSSKVIWYQFPAKRRNGGKISLSFFSPSSSQSQM